MATFRKDSNGNVVPVAGNIVQRWNNKIFTTTHTVVDGKDYYDIGPDANKYLNGLTPFTEFQLYLVEPNETDHVIIRYLGQELRLYINNTSDDVMDIILPEPNTLKRRHTLYTLDTSDGRIWQDSVNIDNLADLYELLIVEWDL